MPEIERKWVLESLPQVFSGEGVSIIQGYIFTDSGELRVRLSGDHCDLTVKGEGNLSRDEWKTYIPQWVFDTLWPKTEGRRIEKVRYALGDLEVDVYCGHLEGLVTLECEFPNEEAAHDFVLPAWAASAVEVTNDQAYKNKNLAVHGLPNERRKGWGNR